MTDGPRQHPATAHLPESQVATCSGCAHYRETSNKERGRCWKWAKFMGLAYRYEPEHRMNNRDWWRGLPTIAQDTAACKYLERPAT